MAFIPKWHWRHWDYSFRYWVWTKFPPAGGIPAMIVGAILGMIALLVIG